jgi:3-dehydroquinate synthase
MDIPDILDMAANKETRTDIRAGVRTRVHTSVRIGVRSGTGTYEVLYGAGMAGRVSTLMQNARGDARSLSANTGVFLLSSPRVARHWQKQVARGIGARNLRATILFDDREALKSIATVERICRQLIRFGADRRAVLVAVGGGVVGDVSGYAAASYLRGVRLVHVPTTLVAQVDSAIGGKTGVNLPEGKNLVGAFYSPQLVIADPHTLATLPDREFRSGIYEVIKYGVICDAPLFRYLEKNIDRLVARDRRTLDYVIPRCIRSKARVVGRDEREAGLREILNFGHTFAHAFETATAYRRYLHGEAVGWGMMAAARLATRSGMLAPVEARRIDTLVRRAGPLPPLPRAGAARLIEIMGADKKTRGGELRFVLPRKIGKVETAGGIPIPRVRHVLENLSQPEVPDVPVPEATDRFGGADGADGA